MELEGLTLNLYLLEVPLFNTRKFGSQKVLDNILKQ